MKISVVVPAYNEEKLIGRALGHIRAAAGAFEARRWAWELIVCDNNSSDRTAEIARASGAQVVFESENQISRARNRGASVARGDWLLFIDGDSFPSQALFEELAATIESKPVAGGGARVCLDDPRWRIRVMEAIWNQSSRMLGWAAGSFVYCRSDLFRRIGGFSEELFASEEIDFSRRLKQVARLRKLRFIILRGHPLISSGRKMQSVGLLEYLRLLLRVTWSRGGSLRRREGLEIWYDGRR